MVYLDFIKGFVIKNATNVWAIIPKNLIKQKEGKLAIFRGNKSFDFEKVKTKDIMTFAYANLGDKRYNTLLAGRTYYSMDRLEEIKNLLGAMDYKVECEEINIYECKKFKGDFPLLLEFNDIYFILAPKKSEDYVNSEVSE